MPSTEDNSELSCGDEEVAMEAFESFIGEKSKMLVNENPKAIINGYKILSSIVQ